LQGKKLFIGQKQKGGNIMTQIALYEITNKIREFYLITTFTSFAAVKKFLSLRDEKQSFLAVHEGEDDIKWPPFQINSLSFPDGVEIIWLNEKERKNLQKNNDSELIRA